MLWGRRRRERDEAMQRTLDAILAKLSAEPAAPRVDATAVLAEAFGKAADNQSSFVGALSELALKSSARRMGIRGGTKRALTAERQPNGKFAVSRRRIGAGPRCPLCKDPNFRDVTVPMIQAHRQHELEAAQQRLPLEERYDHDDSDTATDPQGGNYQNGSAPAGPA